MSEVYAFTRGNREGDILIVGEAFNREEAQSRLPFMGQPGREFDRILAEAKITSTRCLFTNVIPAYAPKDDFTNFLQPNSERKFVAKFMGVYAKPELIAGVAKLEALIHHFKPKLIVATGNWALWALANIGKISTTRGYSLPSGIMTWRGSELQTRPIHGSTYNLLATASPSILVRAWDVRHLMVHDLRRGALFLSGSKSWGEKPFSFCANPSFSEVEDRLLEWVGKLDHSLLHLSVDIETLRQSHITCIGLADGDFSLCIPLYWVDPNAKAFDYFTLEEEVQVTLWLKKILEHPNCKIIGQNFAYDTQFLTRMMGIHAVVSFDTMLAHHLCWPGTPKSLDMLASLYCTNYVYWKDESQEWSSESDHLSNWTYNCKDTRYTYEIAQELQKVVSALNLEAQYACQLEQWNLTREIGLRGVLSNQAARATMRKELLTALHQYETFLLSCMPDDLKVTPSGKPWFNSPKFAMEIFYHYLGIAPVLHKKTKKPTLDASSFEALKKRALWLSPVFDALEKYRSVGVFVSHFLDAKLSSDGRFMTSFNVGGTETFRWSSNVNPFGEGTNLQNIPKGD